MAVAIDAVGPNGLGAGTTTAATLSWTHAVSASGCAIVAAVALGAASGTNGTTINAYTLSATCGGVAMTSLGKVFSDNASNGYVQLFGITGQTSGSKTLVATSSGSSPLPTSLTGG